MAGLPEPAVPDMSFVDDVIEEVAGSTVSAPVCLFVATSSRPFSPTLPLARLN